MNMPDISDKLDDIKERLIVIETKMEGIRDIPQRLEVSTKLAEKGLDTATRAHHRLDRYDDNLKWIWRALAGAVVIEAIRIYQSL